MSSVLFTSTINWHAFFRAGQSNMELTMNEVFNSTEEISLAVNYPNIRLLRLPHMMSPTEEEDLNLAPGE